MFLCACSSPRAAPAWLTPSHSLLCEMGRRGSICDEWERGEGGRLAGASCMGLGLKGKPRPGDVAGLSRSRKGWEHRVGLWP